MIEPTFERRWARLRSDASTTNRVVEIDGRVVGHIASFDLEGHREVTYWIGREDWGRGIATRALQEFLQLEATRPLYAGAASDNAASIRVLTKCGFLYRGRGARVRSWAQRGNGRGRAPTRCMTPTCAPGRSASQDSPSPKTAFMRVATTRGTLFGIASDPGRVVRRTGERRPEEAAGTRESWDDAVLDLVQ